MLISSVLMGGYSHGWEILLMKQGNCVRPNVASCCETRDRNCHTGLLYNSISIRCGRIISEENFRLSTLLQAKVFLMAMVNSLQRYLWMDNTDQNKSGPGCSSNKSSPLSPSIQISLYQFPGR